MLIEARTYRHKGHSRLDTGERYRPAEEVREWLERDPLLRAAAILPAEVAAALRRQVDAEIEAAVADARAAPWPDPDRERGASATKERA
jgi:pyruvate dehydrogenase E1 component alpha subunit